MGELAAADGLYDQNPVPVGQGGLGMQRPRQDLAVELDRDAAFAKAQLIQQLAHGAGRVEAPGLVVDKEIHAAKAFRLVLQWGPAGRV